ncbi:MAG: hypothetical protein IEMM0008_0335 [bacterium]|nr:MAG: hypothetical protein IEMM0008_0335 [bacterium]
MKTDELNADPTAKTAKKRAKHSAQKEEPNKDWFIEVSEKFIHYIEKHRKQVLAGMGGALILLVAGAAFYFFSDRGNEKLQDLYYDADQGFLKQIEGVESSILSGTVLTQDEKDRIKKPLMKGYKKLLSETESSPGPVSYLAEYKLGIAFYTLREYKNAIHYFEKATQDPEAFPLAFQAALNVGHSYFNMGYTYQHEDNWKEAIENYKKAIENYQKLPIKYIDSPGVPLSYRYNGLANEYLAEAYSQFDQKDKVKPTLEKSKSMYQKYKDFIKANSKYLSTSKMFMRQSDPVKDAIIGMRRVEKKLDQ